MVIAFFSTKYYYYQKKFLKIIFLTTIFSFFLAHQKHYIKLDYYFHMDRNVEFDLVEIGIQFYIVQESYLPINSIDLYLDLNLQYLL